MRVFLRTTRCPKCEKRGLDTRGDNLAIYPDGHEHCYACGYHKGIPVAESLRKLSSNLGTTQVTENSLTLPPDCTKQLSVENLIWLRSYDISDQEIEQHNICHSPSKNLLIFPVFSSEGHMIMWQGRDFSKNSRSKYLTKGKSSDIIHIVSVDSPTYDTIIITEDVVSAIKVGRRFPALPLWGSYMPLGTLRKLSERFYSIGVWLDSDKELEALRTVLRASQFIPSFLITTNLDPKSYSKEEIASIVLKAKGETIFNGLVSDPIEENLGVSINHHDPQSGETYSEWCERLFVPPCEKALADFMHRRQKKT